MTTKTDKVYCRALVAIDGGTEASKIKPGGPFRMDRERAEKLRKRGKIQIIDRKEFNKLVAVEDQDHDEDALQENSLPPPMPEYSDEDITEAERLAAEQREQEEEDQEAQREQTSKAKKRK